MFKIPPKVSIITVCYNSEETIADTINSVLSQRFEDFEIIIIDGNSSDNTLEILSRFDDKRISILSENDDGIYDAMNKGLAMANGDIICILNSDDMFANNNVLTSVVNKFKTTNADLIYAGISYINQKKVIKFDWLPSDFVSGSYKKGFHTPHPGFFVKRKIYAAHGNFDTKLKVAADFDVMLRFMENKNIKSEKLDEIVVLMKTGGTSAKFKNILIGLRDIKKSLEKAEIKVNFIFYSFNRYASKIIKRSRLF